MKNKYFIEHKETHTWLRYDGELTNDPNDAALLSFKERFLAERWFRELEPVITSNFAGTTITTDNTLNLQNYLRALISQKNNGADLYKDFIVTEHEFI